MSYVKNIEFEKLVCEAVLRRDVSNVPVTWYLGLGTGVQPPKNALLSDVVETFGPGYARAALPASSTGFPTLALAAGDYKITAIVSSFIATGVWTAADYLFLTNVPSGLVGKLYGSIAIPEPFAQTASEQFDAVYAYLDTP